MVLKLNEKGEEKEETKKFHNFYNSSLERTLETFRVKELNFLVKNEWNFSPAISEMF